jgi:hypothetical protein
MHLHLAVGSIGTLTLHSLITLLQTASHSEQRLAKFLSELACPFQGTEPSALSHSVSCRADVAQQALHMCLAYMAECMPLDTIVSILPDEADCSNIIDALLRACKSPLTSVL